MPSSSEITWAGIRSIPACKLTSRWSWESLSVIFDISNFPGRSLSSRVPAVRPLRLSFSNFLVHVLFADLVFRFAPLNGSTTFCSCKVADLYILRTFQLVILYRCCYWFSVSRYFPGLESDTADILYTSPGSPCFRSSQSFPNLLFVSTPMSSALSPMYSAE